MVFSNIKPKFVIKDSIRSNESNNSTNTNNSNYLDSALILELFNFKKKEKKRAEWTGKMDFFLAALGYAVGLSCIWRYPALAYRDGGGAFLIPYVIFTLLLGIPLVFLELSIGQYTSTGTLTCWTMIPMLRGIGISMNLANGIVSTYYNMIIAYSLYYLSISFTSKLPWEKCNPSWSSINCIDNYKPGEFIYTECKDANNTIKCNNGKCFNNTITNLLKITNETLCDQSANYTNGFVGWWNPVFPSQDFWNNVVLNKSNSIETSGDFQWKLASVLIASWIVVFFLIVKGVKGTGKVVYFTTLFPYVVLLILGIQGWLLDGASIGIEYYIKPDIEKLKDITVWQNAATQIFFTLSVSYGGLLTFASYNSFTAPIFRDSIILCILSCLTSIFAGFVVFPYIGYLSKLTGQSIDMVLQDDAGLAFVVFPFAVTQLKGSIFWSILFFIMMFSIGLDTMMASVETTVTAILDIFPVLKKAKKREYLTTFSVCLFYCLLGFMYCSQNGIYWVHLFDSYSGYWGVLTIAFFECITVGWIYGFNNYRRDVSLMIGDMIAYHNLFNLWRLCFMIICPLILIFLIFYTIIESSPISLGNYTYPYWTHILGNLINLFIISGIFLFGIVKFIKNKFKKKPLKSLITPPSSYAPLRICDKARANELKILLEQKDRVGSYKKFDGLFNYGFEQFGKIYTIDIKKKQILDFQTINQI